MIKSKVQIMETITNSTNENMSLVQLKGRLYRLLAAYPERSIKVSMTINKIVIERVVREECGLHDVLDIMSQALFDRFDVAYYYEIK